MPSDKWRVIASGSIEYPVQQTGSQLWLLSARSGLCPLFRQTLEPGVRHSVRQASAASHVLWAAVAELHPFADRALQFAHSDPHILALSATQPVYFVPILAGGPQINRNGNLLYSSGCDPQITVWCTSALSLP